MVHLQCVTTANNRNIIVTTSKTFIFMITPQPVDALSMYSPSNNDIIWAFLSMVILKIPDSRTQVLRVRAHIHLLFHAFQLSPTRI